MLSLSRVCNIRLLKLNTFLNHSNRNILNIYKNYTKKSLFGYSNRNIWTAVKTSNVIWLNGTTSLQLSLSEFSGHNRAKNRVQITRAIAFGTLILFVVPFVSYCVLELAVEAIVQEVVETSKGK